MTERGDTTTTGFAANVENIVETSSEFAKTEMTDTAEALQDDSLNVAKSETNGETNPPENQSLEVEEMEDQVNLACMMLRIVCVIHVIWRVKTLSMKVVILC